MLKVTWVFGKIFYYYSDDSRLDPAQFSADDFSLGVIRVSAGFHSINTLTNHGKWGLQTSSEYSHVGVNRLQKQKMLHPKILTMFNANFDIPKKWKVDILPGIRPPHRFLHHWCVVSSIDSSDLNVGYEPSQIVCSLEVQQRAWLHSIGHPWCRPEY